MVFCLFKSYLKNATLLRMALIGALNYLLIPSASTNPKTLACLGNCFAFEQGFVEHFGFSTFLVARFLFGNRFATLGAFQYHGTFELGKCDQVCHHQTAHR